MDFPEWWNQNEEEILYANDHHFTAQKAWFNSRQNILTIFMSTSAGYGEITESKEESK